MIRLRMLSNEFGYTVLIAVVSTKLSNLYSLKNVASAVNVSSLAKTLVESALTCMVSKGSEESSGTPASAVIEVSSAPVSVEDAVRETSITDSFSLVSKNGVRLTSNDTDVSSFFNFCCISEYTAS